MKVLIKVAARMARASNRSGIGLRHTPVYQTHHYQCIPTCHCCPIKTLITPLCSDGLIVVYVFVVEFQICLHFLLPHIQLGGSSSFVPHEIPLAPVTLAVLWAGGVGIIINPPIIKANRERWGNGSDYLEFAGG